jgi:uncharacterized membrane-anchored protein YhcB (DUF1043 family)
MSKKIDILVQSTNNTRFQGQQFKGVDHFSTKAEFLKYMGIVWDTVVHEPYVQSSVQLTNMESKEC